MKLITPLLILLAVVLACTPPPSSRTGSDAKAAPKIVNAVDIQSALSKLKWQKNWGNVRLTENNGRMIVAYLDYNSMPNGVVDVNLSTKIIAKTIINALKEHGVDPRDESITIFVHAQMPETSPTGRSMTRRFGKAMYDPYGDNLTFEEIR